MSSSETSGVPSVEVIRHHLKIFGLGDTAFEGAKRAVLCNGDVDDEVLQLVMAGCAAVVLTPTHQFLGRLAIEEQRIQHLSGSRMLCKSVLFPVRDALCTLHGYVSFQNPDLQPVVTAADGGAVWASLKLGLGTILLLGTDLARDLVRFRQGDPSRILQRPTDARWGIAGERPNYLFEQQVAGLPRYARSADEWCEVLAATLSSLLRIQRLPMLPGNAVGAVVLTGDDDQAHLDKYAEQLDVLAGTPITYFLHPLTKHTRKTLDGLRVRNVEFGIHPDALAEPEKYSKKLLEQCRWYRRLTGESPLFLRNHGYLNDGYWGHARPWLKEGIRFSSNLPGLDGNILNGSLLPARLMLEGVMSSHWSVLTAIGDGVRYVDGGKTDEEAADSIVDLGRAVRASGIPGVIVINFHPQNISDTKAMHAAALELVRSGFVPWTMKSCLEWFEAKEPGLRPPARKRRAVADAFDAIRRKLMHARSNATLRNSR